MLKALGGTRTIHDVCSKCNQDFGDKVDIELLRESPLAMYRLLHPQGPSSERVVFQRLDELGLYVDCLTESAPLRFEPCPQLLLASDRWTLVGSDVVISQIESAMTKGVNTFKPKRLIADLPEWDPPRVVYRDGRLYLRARTDHTAEGLVTRLVAGREHLKKLVGQDAVIHRIEHGGFRVRMHFDVNAPARCAAKMAFNLLCLHLGPDVALLREFDPVRRYITGEDVEPVVAVPSVDGGEVGVTVDTRFVANWISQSELPPLPFACLQNRHLIWLMAYDREVYAVVDLYGKMSFKIRLGRVPPEVQVNKPLPVVLATPIGGGGDELLTVEELVRREGWIGGTRRRT